MALRHAVLVALLDGEFSGYQLAKGRTWPQRPTERVPERTGLPQPVPSCTG